MDGLPDFLILMARNPAVRKAVVDLFNNKRFVDSVRVAVTDPGRDDFDVVIGDESTFNSMNEQLGGRLQPSEGAGGFTAFSIEAGNTASSANTFLLPSRFPKEMRADSARNAQLLRDALIHEFAHILGVAKTRSLDDRIKDPKPGTRAADSDILRAENALRGILGLPGKDFYGLLLEDR